jgi:hypothetical protein
MQRRQFLAGVAGAAVLPIPFGRQFVFRNALRKAVRIKQQAGELGAKQGELFESILNKFVKRNGRVATVARHVRDEVNPPWWRNVLTWILENWETILKVLLTLVALLEVQ